MTTISVTATEDYRDGPVPAPVVTDIIYTNGGSAIATFESSQFGGLISQKVKIAANASGNIIKVILSATGTFSAAAWQFVDWNNTFDDIQFHGTAGNDTITGTSLADAFLAIGGADILNGGRGRGSF